MCWKASRMQMQEAATRRRSTSGGVLRLGRPKSGGVLRLGRPTLCAWSSSLVSCASEAIGLRETLKDLQLSYSIRLWTDASAARGLALRTGAGQIKHMQATCCWLQECIKAGILTVEKTRGTVSASDPMTKHLDGTTMCSMCTRSVERLWRRS